MAYRNFKFNPRNNVRWYGYGTERSFLFLSGCDTGRISDLITCPFPSSWVWNCRRMAFNRRVWWSKMTFHTDSFPYLADMQTFVTFVWLNSQWPCYWKKTKLANCFHKGLSWQIACVEWQTLVHLSHFSFCVSIGRQKVRLLLYMVASIAVWFSSHINCILRRLLRIIL